MSAKPRPGYVYILKNPLLDGWVKVGRTKRPPHKRAKELSTTAWPENFEVAYAKFFWDSVHAERYIHEELENALGSEQKKKEFFKIDPYEAAERLSYLDDPIWKQTSILDSNWDPAIDNKEMLEDRWMWAEEKILIPAERNQGWRELEELSAEGWTEGSVRLAEKLMGKFNNPEHFKRASWVWQAAADQGAMGAEVWAKWCRSWPDNHGLIDLLDESWEKYHSNIQPWPSLLMDLFETEIFFWQLKPERAFSHPWWGELAKHWQEESLIMGENWNPNRKIVFDILKNKTIKDENIVLKPIKPS